jgi:hypothetical protein
MVLAFVAALASGLESLPQAMVAVRLVRVALDPVAQTRISLEAVPSQQLIANAEQASADDDADLAASYLALADDRNVVISETLRQAVAEANAFDVTAFEEDARAGFAHGEATTPAGFAAALALDLTAIGDVKDLVVQAAAYPDHDILILSLASVGLALTGASFVTVGAATPAKLGASTLKIARKARLLHPRFVSIVARTCGVRCGRLGWRKRLLPCVGWISSPRAVPSLDRSMVQCSRACRALQPILAVSDASRACAGRWRRCRWWMNRHGCAGLQPFPTASDPLIARFFGLCPMPVVLPRVWPNRCCG